jgi:transglutaminase/protease-like cytokinesis protein 3
MTDAEGNTYPTEATKSSEELASIVADMVSATTGAATTVVDTSGNSENGEVRTSKDRYAYNTLTDEEKALYDNIIERATVLGLKVDPEYRGVDKATWDKVYGMVYNQEPQLFWVSPKLSQVGRIYYRNLDIESIKTMQAEIDATVKTILADISGKTDFEKLDYLNTYLATNSTFLLGEETDTQANYNTTIYNAFSGGTAKQGDIQCVGYAHAVQYICDRVGINSMVVTGVTESGQSHAWNKIELDGDWYNYDVTWNDPILDTPNYKNVRHMFMLIPDSWILDITHFSENMKFYADGTSFKYFTPPACTSTALNWFHQKGELYTDAASAIAELNRQLDYAASNGLRTAEIMVSDKSVYDAVRAEMRNMQSTLKSAHSNVTAISDKCSEPMLIIELDVLY